MNDEGNRFSMFTVRNAENAMIAFTVFAIAITVLIFLHELLIDRSGIVKSLYAIAKNVSNILSAATLLTIFEEGLDLMLFRRTREERVKLKEEKRQLEELKKSVNRPQENSPQDQKTETPQANNKSPKQSSKSANPK